jgi:hypothetical protein
MVVNNGFDYEGSSGNGTMYCSSLTVHVVKHILVVNNGVDYEGSSGNGTIYCSSLTVSVVKYLYSGSRLWC